MERLSKLSSSSLAPSFSGVAGTVVSTVAAEDGAALLAFSDRFAPTRRDNISSRTLSLVWSQSMLLYLNMESGFIPVFVPVSGLLPLTL
jgi:hypothetical protein